ncbi:kinase-like domain-containing protein [Mycena epipterygia]|nr:kinase-like domain-containing protein [Mycena epipterygia]
MALYKALDTRSSPTSPTYYAVKCLGFGTHHDKREIDLHTICSTHPSVIALRRHFYINGCLCVVLELAAGDLLGPIENGVFEKKNALIKEVFLHLVDARGWANVRIADFGLTVDDKLPCATAAGTTCYMSPESLTLGRATQSYEAAQSDVWALCIILLNLISGAFPWLKAVKSDAGWCSFLLSDTYFLRNCPISSELNDLLRKCFRPIPGARPSLDELGHDVANMNSLLKVEPESASHLLIVPRARGRPSAPSTADISFEFSPSDYPSPATSDATSMFVELNPVRLFDMARSRDAEIPASLVTSSPSLADLSPAAQEMIIRLRARPPPLAWLSIDLARKYSTAPASVPKKPSRNPLKRLCHWFQQTRRAPWCVHSSR